jgi:hypothetical protein
MRIKATPAYNIAVLTDLYCSPINNVTPNRISEMCNTVLETGANEMATDLAKSQIYRLTTSAGRNVR